MIMCYLIVLALLLGLEFVYFKIAAKFNIIDKPNERSSHSRVTLRGGGIVFLLGILLYALFFGITYPWFGCGLVLIALISFADDVHSVPNRVRIVVHFVSMLLMFYEWDILEASQWVYVLAAWIVCTGIINAFNFMDGINGITGGYSLSVLVPLMIVNRNTPFVSQDLLLVVGMSLLVFCFFNFRTKARCFAGDVGAVSIAFILLFALGRLILQTGELWYLIFFAVYGVDSVLTICHRLMLHENIFKPHRKHAYQLMANELKMPHVAVSSIYLALQLVISIGAIYLPMDKWLYFGVTLALLCAAYIVFMHRYYPLHAANLKTLNK